MTGGKNLNLQMSKKISGNPSYQRLRVEMGQMDEFRKVLMLLDPMGQQFPDLAQALNRVPELQIQLEDMASLPDEFNNHYSERGWIAYESMESSTLQLAVQLAREGKVDEGESMLVQYYHPEKLKFKINLVRGVKEFGPRMRLIELAMEDYFAGRYHSSIPILLMMIDGVVNDITKDLGLFAENVDVSAWDSIAAHESGLGHLLTLIGKTRKKTNSGSIEIPFRHGIMHGKELAYDNLVVAAKTWGLLFAVRDWIVAKRKAMPQEKILPSIEESLEQLRKIDESNRAFDKWKPRRIIFGVDFPKTGTVEDYQKDSPEQSTVQFLHYWINKNFGRMSEMILRNETLGLTNKKIAGELREALSTIAVENFEIKEADDKAPSVTEICVVLTLRAKSGPIVKEIYFRWIYMDREGMNIGRWDQRGRWYLIDNFHWTLSP